jgi:hypothetical protein
MNHQECLNIAMTKDAGFLRRALGRVVTNVVDPIGYGAVDKAHQIFQRGLGSNLKAIWNDRPAYDTDAITLARELPYRRMYGLPARSSTARSAYTKNPDGSFQFNSNSPLGAMAINEVTSPLSMDPKYINKSHLVMGTYDRAPIPNSMGDVNYHDRWDFDLNPGESALTNPARWLMSKITKPVTIAGRASADVIPPYFYQPSPADIWRQRQGLGSGIGGSPMQANPMAKIAYYLQHI